MLISRALAHGGSETGSSGGGNALLIILAAIVLLGVARLVRKKFRERWEKRADDGASREDQ
jgi:hypothetical protein